MINFGIATSVRAALVAICIGAASVSLVSTCGMATSRATDGVYGNPDAAAKYWQQQSLEDNCGLASVADVVGEVTGKSPSEDQIIRVAQSTPSSVRNGPIYLPTGDPGHETDKGGIDMADAVVLLTHYGIKSRMTYDAHPDEVGLPKLEEYLAANRKVIAWVNSGTILGSDDQRTSADHFLVVTGIDTNQGIVHLNDPYADHADTKVSIDKFMKAWKIGQQSIVVTAQAA